MNKPPKLLCVSTMFLSIAASLLMVLLALVASGDTTTYWILALVFAMFAVVAAGMGRG